MKKLLGILLFGLLLTNMGFSANLPTTWGISNMKCSKIMQMKKDLGETFDEWLFVNAQGYLSGLNLWHYEKYKVAKKIEHNDSDYVVALMYNNCKRDKNKIVGIILLEYLISLPDDN